MRVIWACIFLLVCIHTRHGRIVVAGIGIVGPPLPVVPVTWLAQQQQQHQQQQHKTTVTSNTNANNTKKKSNYNGSNNDNNDKNNRQVFASSSHPVNLVNSLAEVGPSFVAPILYGGLGNMLFQLAATHAYAWQHNIPCLVGRWRHWNRRYAGFGPWGGHPAPFAGATLKTAYPRLLWYTRESFVSPRNVANRYAFELKRPDEYIPLPEKPPPDRPLFVHGYFFSSLYWHAWRSRLVDLFSAAPAIEEYIDAYYGHVLGRGESDAATTSLHIRMGYDGEPSQSLLSERTSPPHHYYSSALRIISKERVGHILVFCDDCKKARAIVSMLESEGHTLSIVRESNVVASLALMTRCKNHILTSSTLSFWGAYLDKRQPRFGKTILHTSFFKDHGHDMIPAEYQSHWTVLDE
eukprot:UC1_evm2s1704